VNVRQSLASVGDMSYTAWAEDVARSLLEEPLPRRWAHVQGVADTARTLTTILGSNADLLTAAAVLHDIGYAPGLQDSGFHPLDGARHLRDVAHADAMLCRLVAHHSCAIIEAEEHGLAADLAREFKPAPRVLADALIYCDMTTGPDGQRMAVGQRLADIRARYGPAHPVTRALARSAPQLTAATHRVVRQLSSRTQIAGPVRVVRAFAF
jgi:HD domain